MPANYSILPHFNLVVVRYSGALTAEESMNSFMGYMTSREALVGRPVLVDCNQIDSFDMQGVSVASFAQQKIALLDPRIPPVEVAFYAPEPHQFAIAEPFTALLSYSPRMRATVHRRVEAALAALNVDAGAMHDPSILGRA